jgi:hypothetical protein
MTTSAGRTLHIIDAHLQIRGVPAARSITAAGEESSSIRAIAARRHLTARANLFVRQLALFELQINATASGVDSNAALCGRNADYHAGLI